MTTTISLPYSCTPYSYDQSRPSPLGYQSEVPVLQLRRLNPTKAGRQLFLIVMATGNQNEGAIQQQAGGQEPQPAIDVGHNCRGEPYPPFNLANVMSYTNRQVRAYQYAGAITLTSPEATNQYLQAMERRTQIMQVNNWDGETPAATRDTLPESESGRNSMPSNSGAPLSLEEDGEPDYPPYPESVPNDRGVKIAPPETLMMSFDMVIFGC